MLYYSIKICKLYDSVQGLFRERERKKKTLPTGLKEKEKKVLQDACGMIIRPNYIKPDFSLPPFLK